MSIFENDWMMRQISNMTKLLRTMLFHKASEQIMILEELSDEDSKTYYQTIHSLIEEEEYAVAMQYLKENFHSENLDYLKVALCVFDQLNALEDQQLRQHSYSKDQLYTDLNFISEQFGIQL